MTTSERYERQISHDPRADSGSLLYSTKTVLRNYSAETRDKANDGIRTHDHRFGKPRLYH